MQIWEASGVHTGYRRTWNGGCGRPGPRAASFVIFILAEIDEIEDRKPNPPHLTDDRGYF